MDLKNKTKNKRDLSLFLKGFREKERYGEECGGGSVVVNVAVWCGSGEVECIRSPLQGRRSSASLCQQGRPLSQSQVFPFPFPFLLLLLLSSWIWPHLTFCVLDILVFQLFTIMFSLSAAAAVVRFRFNGFVNFRAGSSRIEEIRYPLSFR